jgi:HTH-type transcriptional regulator/antitoxin HigA
MTLTFNAAYYKELLAQYQLKTLRTEAENEEALALVEALMHQSVRSPEEDELYELLVTLIEQFEQNYYAPDQSSTPHSLLGFLIEQRGLKQADLVGVIGSQDVVSEVVNGKRKISQAQAKILGEFFHVEPGLFI